MQVVGTPLITNVRPTTPGSWLYCAIHIFWDITKTGGAPGAASASVIGPAKLRRHAEKPERVRGDEAGGKLERPVLGGQQRIFEPAADDIFENLALLPVIEKLRHLKCRATVRLAPAGVPNLDVRDPLDVRIGRRIQEDVLNDAENRRRAANTEAKREDGHQREARPGHQPAETITDVQPHVLKHAPP